MDVKPNLSVRLHSKIKSNNNTEADAGEEFFETEADASAFAEQGMPEEELMSAEPSFSFTKNPFRVHRSSLGIEDSAESGTHMYSNRLSLLREGRGGWEADVEKRSDGGSGSEPETGNLPTSFAPQLLLPPGTEQGGVESPVPKWRQQVFEEEDGNEGQGLEEPWQEGTGAPEEEGGREQSPAKAGMGAGQGVGGGSIGGGGGGEVGKGLAVTDEKRGQWWVCCGGQQKSREGSGGEKGTQGGAAGGEGDEGEERFHDARVESPSMVDDDFMSATGDTLSAVSSMSYQRAVLGEAGLAANKAAGMPGNGHRRTMLPKVTSGTAGRKPNPVSTTGGSSGPGDAKKGAGLPTAAEGAGKGVWAWPKSIPSRLRDIRLGPGAGAGEEKGGEWESGPQLES